MLVSGHTKFSSRAVHIIVVFILELILRMKEIGCKLIVSFVTESWFFPKVIGNYLFSWYLIWYIPRSFKLMSSSLKTTTIENSFIGSYSTMYFLNKNVLEICNHCWLKMWATHVIVWQLLQIAQWTFYAVNHVTFFSEPLESSHATSPLYNIRLLFKLILNFNQA